MNEELLNLRNQLILMLDTIDNYITLKDEVIILKKDDMKHLNFLCKNYDRNLFEYKNSIRFVLDNSKHRPHEKSVYEKIMDGTVERIILNKYYNEMLVDGNLVNYKLEEWEKTQLRDNYNKNE